jgi:hypothetical protein
LTDFANGIPGDSIRSTVDPSLDNHVFAVAAGIHPLHINGSMQRRWDLPIALLAALLCGERAIACTSASWRTSRLHHPMSSPVSSPMVTAAPALLVITHNCGGRLASVPCRILGDATRPRRYPRVRRLPTSPSASYSRPWMISQRPYWRTSRTNVCAPRRPLQCGASRVANPRFSPR